MAYENARAKGRPIQYLNKGDVSKEDLAREIARKDKVTSGLIALFSAVEPCWSYSVRGDRETKKIHLCLELRKCSHLYHYYLHPQFGLIHVRVQTWFPFTVQVCLRGREWLARQMDQAGLAYEQRENCRFGLGSGSCRGAAGRRGTKTLGRNLPKTRPFPRSRSDSQNHRTHRWTLTESGRRLVTALLAARNADIDQLTQLAA